MISIDTPEDALAQPPVIEAIKRGVLTITDTRIKYSLYNEKSFVWTDPEEWVRAFTVAWLMVERGYPATRMKVEVNVPRRTPNDYADIVVYSDDACRQPYLIVENKSDGQSATARKQAIEQAFGNANSLRAPLALYDEGSTSFLFDVENHPPTERDANRMGDREVVPLQYGDVPIYTYIAGQAGDIETLPSQPLEARIRRAHSLIWAGGKRDPLTAFDEWSKLLFAKVVDERTTPTGQPRRFQIGTKETVATVSNRIHSLFDQACQTDPSIFPPGTRINLPDNKVAEVVRTLQGISFTRTDIDSIGKAFEQFFGSIFRGGLGQYFTMRQLARFVVAMLNIDQEDYVLDPTAGSGGFLLETLLQVWHRIDENFKGQPDAHIQRIKIDFALTHVYGIEIHEILARICKINLLLHHDGHTNIEANRSALDATFTNARLNPPSEHFTCIVGNPPFGTDISEGDDEQLGSNQLDTYELAAGLKKIDSEQVIIERCINFLEPEGRFGLILPDGLLNNQGERSNCPRTRAFLAKHGKITAIVSLPDHAFRKSGAQNKTSILFFKKFSRIEKRNFDRAYTVLVDNGTNEGEAIGLAISRAGLDYSVFLGEANHVGYTPAGSSSPINELYRSDVNGVLNADQQSTILGEWATFLSNPTTYDGSTMPDCMSLPFTGVWHAHTSHRLDPKYHLFKREEGRDVPEGWIKTNIGEVMRQRAEEMLPEDHPDELFQVMTIAQTGDIRAREAGKGHNPPEWRGSYFADSPGSWFAAHAGDVVFSSIDLWKGCIALVPEQFEGALVSKEFPIYRVIDERLSPAFLQCLLRSRYYQRAFRAITTGHSNRRRTQVGDFEALEIAFPIDRKEQETLIASIENAKNQQNLANAKLRAAFTVFSDHIDGRGDEELPEVQEVDETE